MATLAKKARVDNPCICVWCWKRSGTIWEGHHVCEKCKPKANVNPLGECSVRDCWSPSTTIIYDPPDSEHGMRLCENHAAKYGAVLVKQAQARHKAERKRKPEKVAKPKRVKRPRPEDLCEVCGDNCYGSVCEVCKSWALGFLKAA